jgi:predicted deacylase
MLIGAAARGEVLRRVCVVPVANPLGLAQNVLGLHLGRFSLATGVNFNRSWPELSKGVATRLVASASLQHGAAGPEQLAREEAHNVRAVRAALLAELAATPSAVPEVEMKRRLLEVAATSDVVLDLHCDHDAVMHVYTHTRLMPAMSDLCAELGAACVITASDSGGSPFDEAASHLWAALQDRFPSSRIPMACEAATVELRGESDVSDELARADAERLMRFLQRRGFVACGPQGLPPPPPLLRQPSPLTAVDMIDADRPGLIVWKAPLGAVVQEGQLLAEIVDVAHPEAPRCPVLARQSGVLFGRRRHCLAVPGQTLVKVAGDRDLEWRKAGNLLTA